MKKLIAVLSSAIFLTACGGGGGSSSSENTVKPDSNNIGNTPMKVALHLSLVLQAIAKATLVQTLVLVGSSNLLA